MNSEPVYQAHIDATSGGPGAAMAQSRWHTLNLLFSARGLAILICLALLIGGPVLVQFDIVGAVFAYSALFVMIVFAVLGLLSGRSMRQGFHVALIPPDASAVDGLIAGEPQLFVLRLEGARLPPFFSATIMPRFRHTDLRLPASVITGFSREPRLLSQRIRFPHRGLWSLAGVDVEIQDRLGITVYRWTIPGEDVSPGIRIIPAPARDNAIPVISSAQRSGDAQLATRERSGDPYDLKTYQPSDGVRRILWKVFAKSGQLVSRHPEPSMTPEGQVVALALPRRTDDRLCSIVHSYLAALEQLDLQLLFLCQGAASDGAGIDSVADSADAALNLMISTVWNAEPINESAALAALTTLLARFSTRNPHSILQRIILFVAADALNDALTAEAVSAVGSALRNRGIEPVFVAVEPSLQLHEARAVRQSAVSRWFLIGLPPTADPAGARNDLRTLCARNNWQVIIS